MEKTIDKNSVEQKVITIDGPAASGKTSVSREVARKLSLPWISTGAFYRGLSYVAQQEKVDCSNPDLLVELCSANIWSVEMTEEETQVFYNGDDVSKEIQQESVGNLASQISSIPQVRKALLESQRSLLGEGGLVAEGRDCGSVVFPCASHKIYLTARSESRAQRRAEEQGRSVEEMKQEQEKRDSSDSERKVAPLQVPEGAHLIDTTQLNLSQVVEKVLSFVG